MDIKFFQDQMGCKLLKVEYLKNWLLKYENYFYFLINESSCRKWSKWIEDKTILILPCCCTTREQDCIFIETYYKLDKIVKIHSKEEHFKAIIQEYRLIRNNKEQVSKWIIKHEYEVLSFYSEIEILLELRPYRTLKIRVDENEFKNIIEIKKIYNRLEYYKILKQNK